MFRFLLLGLLRNGQSHGYGLMKLHEARSGVRLSTGNFYRELGKLVDEHLVRPVSNPEGADPRRTPYTLTDAGAALFDDWFTSPPGEPADSDDEITGRSLFFADANPAIAREMLSRWGESLWLRSKVLERARKAALADAAADPDSFSTRPLLISRRLAHVAADIEFLERLTAAYEEWVAKNAAQAQARAKVQAQPAATERKAKATRR